MPFGTLCLDGICFSPTLPLLSMNFTANNDGDTFVDFAIVYPRNSRKQLNIMVKHKKTQVQVIIFIFFFYFCRNKDNQYEKKVTSIASYLLSRYTLKFFDKFKSKKRRIIFECRKISEQW